MTRPGLPRRYGSEWKVMDLLRLLRVFRDSLLLPAQPSRATIFQRSVGLSLCWFVPGLILISSCGRLAPPPVAPSPAHLHAAADRSDASADIPQLAEQRLPAPEPAAPQQEERYTVVVEEAPVRELLFALARDAGINLDIAPGVTGMVTMNAVRQTVPQLLRRVARQVNLRYVMEGENLFIATDAPYFQTYRIDYLNLKRNTAHVVQVGTQIARAGQDADYGGAGANNSTTTIDSATSNHFWDNLVANVAALLATDAPADAAGPAGATNRVVPHPESGLLTVRATADQHALIRKLIDQALANANRQVLIQATIVEVSLTDQYQAGVDWQAINQVGLSGLDLTLKTITSRPVNTASMFAMRYQNTAQDQTLNIALELLEEFGDVSVLSSPQIMALNNQSAILKVVDNVVYFEIEQETNVTQGVAANTFETIVRTVPVGIVMMITPHVRADDSIILNVRPSISRINRFVNDPNPALTVSSPVPEIRVREMEALLRLNNGQIAVMGGLMQNDNRKRDHAVPQLSRIPLLGAAFRMRRREYEKTELVIFLRPIIVRRPDLESDLSAYKHFFPAHDDE